MGNEAARRFFAEETVVTRKEEQQALFWCTLLHDVLFGDLSRAEIRRRLRDIAKHEVVFPDGTRGKPSVSTLWRKLRLYTQTGFESLARRKRSDRGKSRAASPEMIAKAIELKREQPKRSDRTLRRMLRAYYGRTLARSTLYRHLKVAGATRLKLGVTKTPVRKRWTRDHSNALWIGDFEDGPFVWENGEAQPTCLSAFLDVHSRYVVDGRYYLRENFDVLVDTLLRAWITNGLCEDLYADNARIYHAHALRCACYALHVDLLHRKPKDPPGGGAIERFFETVQGNFEAEVRAEDILTLDKLNRSFSAWLSVAYHDEVHSETKQTPRDRYQQGLRVIRPVDAGDILRFFMKREMRTVDRTFSDVRLDSRFYRVDPRLRGDRIWVHWDPFSSRETVLLYSLRDEYLGKGTLHHREEGIPAPDLPPRVKPAHSYLDLLVDLHEKSLAVASRGIDFVQAHSRRTWPFPAFVQTIARLLGRKGGLGAFSADEHELLKKSFDRVPEVTEPLLLEAVEHASAKTLPQILFSLQVLAKTRKES